MKRVRIHARGATIAFLTDELERFGDALGALIDSRDGAIEKGRRGAGAFTDQHMETLAELHTKIRTAALLVTDRDRLSVGAQEHLEKAGLGDLD